MRCSVVSAAPSSTLDGADEILKAIAAAASGESVPDSFASEMEPGGLDSAFGSDFWFGDSVDGDSIGAPGTQQDRAQDFDTIINTNPQLAKSLRQLEPSVNSDFSRWMGTQENGRIDFSELEQVAPGHFLRPDVAQTFKAMRRAARKDGVRITLTDSYRDFATQQRLAVEKGLYSEGGLAAEPGTSNHGWGLAVDVDEGREWLAENGARFGFTTIPREPWHWEYEPGANTEYTPTKNAFRGPRSNKRKKDKPEALTRESILSYKNPYTASAFALMSALSPDTQSERPNTNDRPPGGNAKKPRGGSIQAQLKAGFIEAGRPDLAKMVGTEAFDTWVGQESGWNPKAVSPANNQGQANGGLFQFWFGHAFTDGYVKGSKFTMSVADQAYIAATQFNLTPERIKEFAQQIRDGSYEGWG